jgi:nucleoid DNA-binding protein
MYEELYQYLLQHNSLSLPGIGTFLLERKSAELDFVNKQVNPPFYKISMLSKSTVPTNKQFTWLANTFQISNEEATQRFNEFVENMKSQLVGGDTINWKGVGTLNKTVGGGIKFYTSNDYANVEEPVPAKKIIRERSEHKIRVGEDERTSSEMNEILHHQDEKKNYWWAYAAAIALIGTIFIGWYVSEHGVTISSTTNSKKINAQTTGVTYKILP